MKIAITVILTLLFAVNIMGQNNPDCQYLTVEDIQMDNDTANLMKITISNSCSTCSSGLNGCVYLELSVIKTVSPFDTIASSSCWCLITADNNSQKTYSVTSTVASLPSISDIRVSLYAGECGCDALPFSTTLSVLNNKISEAIDIYPNPFSSSTILQTGHFINDGTLTMYNAHGQQVKQIENISGQQITLHRDNLPGGLYFIRMTQDNKLLSTHKIIVSD